MNCVIIKRFKIYIRCTVLFYHIHKIGIKSGIINRVKVLPHEESLFDYRSIIFVVYIDKILLLLLLLLLVLVVAVVVVLIVVVVAAAAAVVVVVVVVVKLYL